MLCGWRMAINDDEVNPRHMSQENTETFPVHEASCHRIEYSKFPNFLGSQHGLLRKVLFSFAGSCRGLFLVVEHLLCVDWCALGTFTFLASDV
jgi:hypothetical protein